MKRNWILICAGLIGAAIVAGTAVSSIVEEKTGAAEKTEKEITHKGPPEHRRSFSMLRPRRSPLFSPPIFVRSVIAQQHSAVI